MKSKNYLIPILSLLGLLAFIFIFTKVVIYLIVAAVISLLAQPLVNLYSKLRYKNHMLPNSVLSLLALLTVLFLFSSLIYAIFPTLISEIQFLSTLNFNNVFSDIINQFPSLKKLLSNFGTEKEISTNILNQMEKLFKLENIGQMLNSFISVLGSILGGTLAVLFISFFFLKEKGMVYKMILLITPTKFEENTADIIRGSRNLLSKYFVGLSIDILIVSLAVSLSMYFAGIKNAFIIGIFTGLMNVIPYLGPFISLIFASILGVTGCIEFQQFQEIGPTLTKIAIILASVNLLDAFILQPYIFSNTVKAHPLEIFLVIMMAATLAGIWGMVIAIPTYTFLRIVAKEFLTHLKFFKKITDSITDSNP